MRSRQLTTLLVIVVFVTVTILFLRNPDHRVATPLHHDAAPDAASPAAGKEEEKPVVQNPVAVGDLKGSAHPIAQLTRDAQERFRKSLDGQSSTLEAAVSEYKRRYKMNPPPNFDKWFAFAKSKGTPMIDEYDSIYQMTLPFWSLEPSVIRSRAREALGFDNALLGMAIRDGKVAMVEGAEKWQQGATIGMMEGFIKHLPDMDLAFNIHDEPRVVIPHDDLGRLVEGALTKYIPSAFATTALQKTWSARPKDLNDGKTFPEVRTTRFNVFAHQATWTNSRQSCPPDSRARSLDESAEDALEAYAFSELGFVENKTAFSDICNSPSFRTTLGFFDRPNAFNIVHDLFPIFSQSKISSFQDMIYPSPWYWADKVPYSESQDYAWADKEAKLYWRGSTTGGYSRNGGWRRQHRQQVVREVNALNETLYLEKRAPTGQQQQQHWKILRVAKDAFRDLMDVHFSHVGQCDEGDCNAQREFFEVAPSAKQEDAWKYKYLLDVDGNAFSGRFYAFLRSRSLIFKMAIFREWHDEWIKPWVHYIPMSLKTTEYYETLRYIDREKEGQETAQQIAEAGREWAGKMLRNGDLEVWFFRLLLEYGRLVDDNRERLGFSLG